MNDYNNFFDFHSPWYPPFRQAFESAEMPVTDVGRQMSRRSRTRTKNDVSRVDDINNMLRYLHSIFFWLETAFSRVLLWNELSSMSCQLSFACKAHRLTYAFLLLRFSYLKDGIRTEFVKSDLTFGELVTFTRLTLSRGYLAFLCTYKQILP